MKQMAFWREREREREEKTRDYSTLLKYSVMIFFE
jgi:hypothetical protein